MSTNAADAEKPSVTADVPHHLETDREPPAQGARRIFRCRECGAESIRREFAHRRGCSEGRR